MRLPALRRSRCRGGPAALEAAHGEEVVRFRVLAHEPPAHESAALSQLAGTAEQMCRPLPQHCRVGSKVTLWCVWH
jgi:hypothetical protein